jgi:plasmid stability protein
MPKGETKPTRDFLIRGLPVEIAEKLKVAASLHRVSMKDYVKQILEGYVRDLEKRGIVLTLPKGR